MTTAVSRLTVSVAELDQSVLHDADGHVLCLVAPIAG